MRNFYVEISTIGEKMKKHIKTLQNCSLFKDISPDDIERMLICLKAEVISFDKEYTIMADGMPAKYIGIMLSGTARVSQIDYYGNRNIIGIVEKSEIFSEAFACAGVQELPVMVTATEPCEVMFIDSNRVLHTCSGCCDFHQKLIYNLMKNLAEKIVMFHQKIEVTSKRTTREKLLTFLMNCSKQTGSDSFNIPYDRQELADYLGVERSGLSSEISKLKAEGIIENNKNYFVFLDKT